MFSGAASFNGDISNWNVENVADMSLTFANARAFNADISNWDVRNLTKMEGTFLNATAFNGDISRWNVSNVYTMFRLFEGTTLDTQRYDALLQKWSLLPVLNNVRLDAGGSQYTSASVAARRVLTDNKNWMIYDRGQVSYPPSAFVTLWHVEADDRNITIPAFAVGDRNPNYTVDWGDGSQPETSMGQATHTYADAGTFAIQITGQLPWIKFDSNNPHRNKLRTVEQWGHIEWQSFESAFEACENLTITAADVPDLGGVTSTKRMFRAATSLAGNLNGWDTTNITDMHAMFWGASVFDSDLAWDVSNVTDMSSMFRDAAAFNGDLRTWNTAQVTNMQRMFRGATAFAGNLSDWNVENVIDMLGMFWGASNFNSDLSRWEVEHVATMNSMFREATTFNQDLSRWEVDRVTDMRSLFNGAIMFDGDLRRWDVDRKTMMLCYKVGVDLMFKAVCSLTAETPSPAQTRLLRHVEPWREKAGQFGTEMVRFIRPTPYKSPKHFFIFTSRNNREIICPRYLS